MRSPACVPKPRSARDGHAQDRVVARMAVTRIEPIGAEQRREATVRRELHLALDADVLPGGKARDGHESAASVGADGEDPAALLVGRDQVAGKAAEGSGGDNDPALDPGGRAGDRSHSAAAVDRLHRRVSAVRDRHQQAMTETTRLVEGDAVDQPRRRDGGETTHRSTAAHGHHATPARRAVARRRCPSRRSNRGVPARGPRCTARRSRAGHRRRENRLRRPPALSV